MALLSVIMPCYNAERFLKESLNSVINQTFTDWELVIVDDGSSDNSKEIGLTYQQIDSRIRVVSKKNGGYVSARLYGLNYISGNSKYLLFYDADDILHNEMFRTLIHELENDLSIGAIYCNHSLIDNNGTCYQNEINMPRFIPTKYWVSILPESEPYTPFVSILCWTKMIEPMTIIRRTAYENSKGWDIDFGKGKGNVGDGVLLFSEIALNWKVKYISTPLYYYRRHSNQSTAVDDKIMKKQALKVIKKWQCNLPSEKDKKEIVLNSINFYFTRLYAYKKLGSVKHQLRYNPIKGIMFIGQVIYGYLRSVPLIFSKSTNHHG